ARWPRRRSACAVTITQAHGATGSRRGDVVRGLPLSAHGIEATQNRAGEGARGARYDARLDGDDVRRHDDVVHVGRDQGEAGVGEVETIGTKIILVLLGAIDRAAADRSWRRATELHKAVFRGVLIDLGTKTREVEQEKASPGVGEWRQLCLHAFEIGFRIGVCTLGDEVGKGRRKPFEIVLQLWQTGYAAESTKNKVPCASVLQETDLLGGKLRRLVGELLGVRRSDRRWVAEG